jgi:hypothetical protein
MAKKRPTTSFAVLNRRFDFGDDAQDGVRFISNAVITSRYTAWNFLPVASFNPFVCVFANSFQFLFDQLLILHLLICSSSIYCHIHFISFCATEKFVRTISHCGEYLFSADWHFASDPVHLCLSRHSHYLYSSSSDSDHFGDSRRCGRLATPFG